MPTPPAPAVKGSRIAVLAAALVLVAVATVVVWTGESDLLSRHRGALLVACGVLAVIVLLLGLLWVFDFAAEAIPKGSRLFAVLILDGAAIGIAVAAASQGSLDRRPAWLGGMLGVIAVITFFGVLWSFPANVLAKGSVRSALAATVTLVYLTIAGLLIFDLGLLDQAPMGQQLVGEGTRSVAFTDADDIFETMTWAFMVVIGFYFTATTVEAISKDRTTSAAVKSSATDDTLAGLRQQEQDAITSSAQ